MRMLLPYRPQIQRLLHSEVLPGQTRHWVVSAKSRGGILLWQGVIDDPLDVWRWWDRLISGQLGYQDYVVPQPAYCPSIREIEGVTYQLATVISYTAVGTTSFVPQSGVVLVDWLVAAGGGAGGGSATVGRPGGGAGAGGMLTGTGTAVVPGTSYTVTVGAKGTGVAGTSGNPGSNSVFHTNTAIGGGYGGQSQGVAGGNGGSSGKSVV